MFGFLTFGTTLALTDLAVKKEIEARPDEEFPKTVKESGGLIRLYKNHNPGFSFGFMKEYPKLVEMVPVCMLSAVAGAWAYVIGKKGRVLEKTHGPSLCGGLFQHPVEETEKSGLQPG